ncbi:tuberous sclerosis 2, partial [Tremellales sp. Uapishka_1]
MSEREREREMGRARARPTAGHHHSSSDSSSGPLSFLPNIFGRRNTVANRSEPTSKRGSSNLRESSDDVLSPKTSTSALPPDDKKNPFDFDEAVALMEPGATSSVPELCEIVKATAVYLVNLLLASEDIFSGNAEQTTVKARDLRTLYIRGMQYADPTSDYTLRTAAIRLLAVLVATSPPAQFVLGDPEVELPDDINPRSIYRVIAASSGGESGTAKTEQMWVELGALKALTKNGTDVTGMEGIVGWCLILLKDLQEDWIAWCSKREEGGVDWSLDDKTKTTPFAPIRPPTPAETVSSIIDLVSSIVSSHLALFSPSDLDRIVQPILQFFWAGILAATPPSDDATIILSNSLARRSSPASSTFVSPIGTPVFSELSLRKSMSESRTRRESSLHSTPTQNAKTIKQAVANNVASPRSFTSAVRSPSPLPSHPLVRWPKGLASLCAFLEMALSEAALSDELFDDIMVFLCFALGQDDLDKMNDSGWSVQQLLMMMLGVKGKRRGEQALKNILEGKVAASGRTADVERKIARGAIIQVPDPSSFSLSLLVPSLLAAQTVSRFSKDENPTERTKWYAVDYEILAMLHDHLRSLEGRFGGEEGGAAEAWTEGEAACDILSGMSPLLKQLSAHASSEGDSLQAVLNLFHDIIHQLPNAIGRLHSSSSTGPAFHHPHYINLLFDLAPHLGEDEANTVVNYYQRECLCLPFSNGWLDNIWKLLNTYCLPDASGLVLFPAARVQVSDLLFRDVYGYAQDLIEHRAELMETVILPFLEQVMVDDAEQVFQRPALEVLVSAAVAETMERDEERRAIRANKERRELEEEDAAALPPREVKEAATGGCFNTIRSLIIQMASQTSCRETNLVPNAFSVIAAQATTFVEGLAESRRGGREGRPRETASGLRNLTGGLSPPSKSTQLPPFTSTITSTLSADVEEEPTISQTAPTPHAHDSHDDCNSLRAVQALIAIFTQLAFALPHSLSSNVKAARTPASSRSITIYRDLLGLLYAMSDASDAVSTPQVTARCPKARLIILQWLLRLRADRKHRIYFRLNLDKIAAPFAATLYRTKETEDQIRASIEAEETRRKARANPPPVKVDDERGRALKQKDTTGRSRSRSKHVPIVRTAPTTDGGHPYNPLWCIPQNELFEMPTDQTPSEGMTTYDPNHPSLRFPDAPPVEGVWLPVSEYVRVLNGILRYEKNWELVSYILVFLPLQLTNKLFFHGKRASQEVVKLLDILCDQILPEKSDYRWENRLDKPSFIKRTQIHAVAYQSLSILISYKTSFSKTQCDRLIVALTAGLESNALLAKPCIQALTIAIFELEQHVGKQLLEIIRKMQAILMTPAMAVHILEFLDAVGQNGNLYRNFRDEEYRLVFAVAIQYISEHNARSDSPIDMNEAREAFTLSQHVIGLAYHSIYIWFMALKLSQRPSLVGEITRGLLHAKSQRGTIDEMAEVCFDWLARYTYGNADPKPASSFLSDMVMKSGSDGEPPKSESWLLGGALMTITSHARSGWATISATRPTGSTSVICKLQNVPLLGVGENQADLVSLPAVLMADRNVVTESRQNVSQPARLGANSLQLPDPTEIVSVASTTTLQPADPISQHGLIWSGATPSQRRKDVVIEPQYLAFQLLSSYPDVKLDTPRGRLIPNEDKYMRSLRMIENTPVIDTLKIAVLYVGPGQKTETDILGNIDGSPLYLDFLSGLGRLIRLKGQVDVFTGGLNRVNDADGEYAYAWWDDLSQTIFHTPTMMPNQATDPIFDQKKRLVGNDFVRIVYNDSGGDYDFETIKTAFNFVNVVISVHTTGDAEDTEDYFKVLLQRAPGIPDFSPVGELKLVSKAALPILVRQIAHHAHDISQRFMHIRNATDAASAEFITSWRSRLRAMERLKASLPPVEVPDESDVMKREEMLREWV